MRTKESDCLLCLVNKATKENSHIISRFMSKGILGEGNQKRGYSIGTTIAHLPPGYFQDTPKENFILCPSCEKYFEVLETYIAQRLNNRIWDVRHKSEFTFQESEGGIRWKICNEIDPFIFRLFIYSIVWRCSISNTKLAENFKLENDEGEILRNVLLKFKFEKQDELLNASDELKKGFPFVHFIIFTAEVFANKTENFLCCNPMAKNPYHLLLGEYGLLISFKEVKENLMLAELTNSDLKKIKVGFFEVAAWKRIMDSFLKMIAEKSWANLVEKGELPWIVKKENIARL